MNQTAIPKVERAILVPVYCVTAISYKGVVSLSEETKEGRLVSDGVNCIIRTDLDKPLVLTTHALNLQVDLKV
jgi:hypothetical protein